MSIFKDFYFLSAISLYPNWTSWTWGCNTLHAISQISQISSTVWFLTTTWTIRTICVRQHYFLLGKRLIQHRNNRYIDVGGQRFNFSLGRYSWNVVRLGANNRGCLHVLLSFLKGEYLNLPCATVDRNGAGAPDLYFLFRVLGDSSLTACSPFLTRSTCCL